MIPLLMFPPNFSEIYRIIPKLGRILQADGDWFQYLPFPPWIIYNLENPPEGFGTMPRPCLVFYTFNNYIPIVNYPVNDHLIFPLYSFIKWLLQTVNNPDVVNYIQITIQFFNSQNFIRHYNLNNSDLFLNFLTSDQLRFQSNNFTYTKYPLLLERII